MNDVTWACVPVKDGGAAKQRLAGVWPQARRTALAQAMLLDVLDAIGAANGLAGIALLTVDAFARAVAAQRGLRVIEDAATENHTNVANAAMRVLARERVPSVLMLPGDIPLVTADEVEQVVRRARNERFTIVPSHDRDGSNAIVCAPPGVVPLRYGLDSFACHLRTARQLGIEPAVIELPGISRDIDHPEDLQFILDSEAPTRAKALLLEFGVSASRPGR
jgi:2-phospho-L-lactate/phosphoenolpyruvate guanylyltransferase